MAGGTDSTRSPAGLFSIREVLAIGWLTLTTVVFWNVVIKLFDRQLLPLGNAPIPRFWPISKFALRIPRLPLPNAAVFAAAALLVFAVATLYLVRIDRFAFGVVAVAGGALLLLTTLTHGVGPGLLRPLSAPGTYDRAAIGIADPGGYYLAAQSVTDPVRFLETFTARQLTLPLHAQTHPPGAVLTFYLLDSILPSALAVSLVTGLGSLVCSVWLLSRLLRTYYPRAVVTDTTFLFVCLPAIQIYFLTTLDAIIAVVVLAAVYCFTRESRWVATIGTLLFVFIASTQTFTFVFVLPVLGVLALNRREKLLPLGIVLVGLLAAYLLLDAAFGFEYLHSFSLASTQQNPGGFMAFDQPLNYVYTRIEDIAEITLFFTPFLATLAVRGTRDLLGGVLDASPRDREPLALFGGAVVSILLLFAGSVYHTGETARGALYLYPFLVVPVAAALRAADATARRRALLFAAVFGQALLMQLVGDYWW